MNGYEIKKIRSDFPMLNPNKKMQGKPLVWLDNASTTFKPKQVIIITPTLQATLIAVIMTFVLLWTKL